MVSYYVGTISESDFMKWIAKRNTTFGHEVHFKPAEGDHASDDASKRTDLDHLETKVASPKKRSKRSKGPVRTLAQDELMRLNHSG